MCLRNVLTFDTTYKTNAYEKSLLMLVGANYRHKIMVFSRPLLMDESISRYEWVLKTFLIAMMNKKSISVVTDGDNVMRKVIKKKGVSNMCHHLCAWHLQ